MTNTTESALSQVSMVESVIFAVDDPVAFGIFMLDLKAKLLLGSYVMKSTGTAVVEQSWLLPRDVFEKKVLDTCFIAKQESVLVVTGCNKQYATLKFLNDGAYDVLTPDIPLGCLKAVSQATALACPEWTYDPTFDRYFVTVPNSQSESPHDRDQRELWGVIDELLDESNGLSDGAIDRLINIRNRMKPKWLVSEINCKISGE